MKKVLIFILMFALFVSFCLGVEQYTDINPYNAVYVWHFNESSGNPVDSISASTITDTGSSPYSSSFVTGTYGNHLDIQNADLLTTENIGLNTAKFNNLTLCFWFYPTGIAQDEVLFSSRTSGSGARIRAYYTGAPNRIDMYSNCDGASPDLNLYSISYFSVNTPYHICFIYEKGGTAKIYINGSLDASQSYTAFDPTLCANNNLDFGDAGTEASAQFKIDDLIILNKSLTSSEIWNIYSGNTTLVVSATPIFISPTPEDLTHNNTQISINVSCGAGAVSIWFSNTTQPNALVVDSQPSPIGYLTSVSIEGEYYYIASCDGGTTNSTIRRWTYDISSPEITLNPTNGFSSSNLTNINSYSNTLPLNISYSDNLDLYAYEVNITKAGVVFFNLTNLTLNGTSANLLKTIDVSTWSAGDYSIELSVSDSHTLTEINPYSVITKSSELAFKTEENNNIRIVTDLTTTAKATKEMDRYKFSFDFGTSKETTKVFNIYSDHKIEYRANSPYKAHFVIYKNGGGNWVDFEGIEGKPIINKISDYHYTVTFITTETKIVFNSIGGLNTVTEFYKWTKGNATPSTPNGYSGTQSSLNLRITKGATISDINANLIYNYTNKETVTKTVFSDYIDFNITISNPVVSTNTTLPIYWNVTATQSDLSTFNFNVSDNHTIYLWGIDNCTGYSIPLFNFTTVAEKSGSPITTNISFSFQNYQLVGDSSYTKSYSIIISGANTFRFCKSGDFELQGDLSFIMQAGGFGARQFIRESILFNSNYTGYMLEDDDSTDNIPFKIVKGDLTPIDGTRVLIYRNINNVDTLIYYGITDFAGQVNPFLDKLYTYSFFINATGYPLKNFSLQPADSVLGYTIKISEGGTPIYDNVYQGIRYRVLPSTTLFNRSNTFQEFSFEIEGTDLSEFGINFSNHNYTCIPANCFNSSTSLTGGKVSIWINLSHIGTMNTAFYFDRIGQERVFVNDGLFKILDFLNVGNSSLLALASSIKENFSPNVITIGVATVNLLSVGIGAFMGLYGALLFIPAIILDIIFSLPDIGFINPLVGMIMVIFGVVMLLLFGLKEGG